MKAIILAAGKGTRLDGAAVKPKCLVEVGGVTLLHRQLEALHAANIKQIVVVVGFGADSIRAECDHTVEFVENKDFATTSSLYSLWLAREHFSDGFVVLNSDVLFHPQMLANLLDSSIDDALLISKTEHQKSPFGDEEMKVKLADGLVADISKEMDPLEADGENVGIVKFSAAGAKLLIGYMNELIANGGMKDWAPRAFREFAQNHPLQAISTDGLPWIEIDFPEDYQLAVSEVYPKIESLVAVWNSSFNPSPTPTVISFDEP
jgi:choline kinase